MVDNSNVRSPSPSEKPGVAAAFPYDRMTVERFRQEFPRARWNDERNGWFVPGKTAERRVNRWLAREAEQVGVHADMKGRDAFDFDPIESPYLEIATDMRIRTPYSRTVLAELRKIPWSHWDDTLRAWRIPFRSYEQLRRSWPTIEAAARRNEPEERKRRRDAERNSPEHQLAQLRSTERRRRRYPLLAEDEPPPIGRPVSTTQYGIVVFTEFTGEIAEDSALSTFYPHLAPERFIYSWGSWRAPTLPELVATWPARQEPAEIDFSRGWWQPTLDELRDARRRARMLERRLRSRGPKIPGQ